MGIIEIIILGIVQGIAEFLPISSSAHLIIFRDVFGIGSGVSNDLALTLDIALHLGTLLAIGIFFFNDFINMIVKGVTKGIKDKQGKMLWFLIIATIPAAIAGLLFEDIIENAPLTFINPRGCKMLGWFYSLSNGKKLLFAVNLDSSSTVLETDLNAWSKARLIYTNSLYNEIIPELENDNGSFFVIPDFYIGECVIYELE